LKGKSVAVIGGGLAGLSAAVFLSGAGLNVSLFESSSGLGGRAYSLTHAQTGIQFDNGKHILAGWYANTFEYLKLIGSYDKLNIPKSFNTVFCEKGGRKFRIKSGDSNPGLLKGLLGFGKFSLKDKLLIHRLISLLKSRDINNAGFAQTNLEDLIIKYKLTHNHLKYFLFPFSYSVFNASPPDISAAVFYNVINRAFSAPGGFSLIVPEQTLGELFIKPSVEFLEKHGAKIHTSSKISDLVIADNSVKRLITSGGQDLTFDYYISAVPFHSFGRLFQSSDLDIEEYFNIKGTLKSASILNVHLFCNSFLPQKIIQLSKDNGNITGFIGTNIQWMFTGEKHISISVSSPEKTIDNFHKLSRDDIKRICVKELGECLSVYKDVSVSDIEIIHEKRATFIPDCESLYARPVTESKINNLFVAGDWTSTGLPSTIESAVESAYKCYKLIN